MRYIDYNTGVLDSNMQERPLNKLILRGLVSKINLIIIVFNEHNFVLLLVSYTVNVFLLSVKHTNTILSFLSMTTYFS
jgi:ABC-type phosphonate transport system ATPase subunit